MGALRPSWSDLGGLLIRISYAFVFCIEFSCGCLALIPVVALLGALSIDMFAFVAHVSC